MAPAKAQQLGMLVESAKILIPKSTETSAHLQTFVQAFSGRT
jgi:hypothetical protein